VAVPETEASVTGTGEGVTTPLVRNNAKPHHAAPPVVDPARRPRTDEGMWKFLDEVAKPSLDAASDLSRLVSSFARYIADLLCADIVSVDQRIDRDTFEPIAVFTSSDRKVHKPGQPPYIYPVEAVGARQLRAATANDGAPHPQNPTWAVVRSMQVWQVGETSERLRADLGQSYSAWSKLLIDRGLRYALAVPVFDLGGLWGQVGDSRPGADDGPVRRWRPPRRRLSGRSLQPRAQPA
jgi:hypothetical protein